MLRLQKKGLLIISHATVAHNFFNTDFDVVKSGIDNPNKSD